MKPAKYEVLGNGVLAIHGAKKGPRIGVVSNVHGNELCGRKAAQRILKNHTIERGSLILIEGNPEAALIYRRFVHTDMNRVFTDKKLGSKSRHQDLIRARYLTEIIPTLGLDLAVDFHSVSSETKLPFTISFPGTEDLANLCPTPRIYGWKGIVKGTLCEWMCEAGVPTVVVEAGQHEAAAAVRHAERTLLSVLSFHQLISLDKPSTFKKQKEFDVIENVQIKDRDTFVLSKVYDNFDKLVPGEIIAKDTKKTYQAPKEDNYSLIMPTTMELVRNGTASGAYYLMKER